MHAPQSCASFIPQKKNLRRKRLVGVGREWVVFRFTRGSFGGCSRMLRLAYKGNTDLDCFGPVEGNGFFFAFLSCSQVYSDTVVSSLSLSLSHSHSLSSFLSLFFFFFLLWGIDGDESECTRIRPTPCEALIANIRECLFPAVANASTIN